MSRIRRFLSSYFGITRREASGFLAIFGLIFIILIAPLLFKQFYRPGESVSQTDQATLDSLVAVLSEQSSPVQTNSKLFAERARETPRRSAFPKKPVRRFPFDPNTATVAQLEELGIPRFIAQRIENYRNKGGQFQYKEDLQRIYDFPDSTYKMLYSYIKLPKKGKSSYQNTDNTSNTVERQSAEETPPKNIDTAISPFELNTATAEELQQIRGIGPTLSARIVSFRDKLGGFYSTAQVYQVYGLDTAVCAQLLKVATLDTLQVRKINLNTATQAELANHPYINKGLARVIVNYRSQHGAYTNADDLRNIRILEEATLQKLLPYLQF